MIAAGDGQSMVVADRSEFVSPKWRLSPMESRVEGISELVGLESVS